MTPCRLIFGWRYGGARQPTVRIAGRRTMSRRDPAVPGSARRLTLRARETELRTIEYLPSTGWPRRAPAAAAGHGLGTRLRADPRPRQRAAHDLPHRPRPRIRPGVRDDRQPGRPADHRHPHHRRRRAGRAAAGRRPPPPVQGRRDRPRGAAVIRAHRRRDPVDPARDHPRRRAVGCQNADVFGYEVGDAADLPAVAGYRLARLRRFRTAGPVVAG